jgi:hypothetical protein
MLNTYSKWIQIHLETYCHAFCKNSVETWGIELNWNTDGFAKPSVRFIAKIAARYRGWLGLSYNFIAI